MILIIDVVHIYSFSKCLCSLQVTTSKKHHNFARSHEHRKIFFLWYSL